MKAGADVVLIAAVRLFAPPIVLLAASLFVWRVAGDGVGVLAGITLALLLVLHALVFGAEAARSAFPPLAARLALFFGVVAALAGAGLPGWRYAPQTIEAGLFLCTIGAAALAVAAIFGRAPTLRDADWR